MQINPSLIKKLREMTNAGMLNCKKALIATEGNLDEAVLWLRKQGISKAAAKANRLAAEGLAQAVEFDDKVILFVLNSETDFVARNNHFKKLATEVATYLHDAVTNDISDALAITQNGVSLADHLKSAIAVLKENIVLSKLIVIFKKPSEQAVVYNHFNGKVATACLFSGKLPAESASEVAMHIAAIRPRYISPAQIDEQILAEEKLIIQEQLKNDEALKSKPEATINRILEGRLNKRIAEICLTTQPLVTDPKIKVSDFLHKHSVMIEQIAIIEV